MSRQHSDFRLGGLGVGTHLNGLLRARLPLITLDYRGHFTHGLLRPFSCLACKRFAQRLLRLGRLLCPLRDGLTSESAAQRLLRLGHLLCPLRESLTPERLAHRLLRLGHLLCPLRDGLTSESAAQRLLRLGHLLCPLRESLTPERLAHRLLRLGHLLCPLRESLTPERLAKDVLHFGHLLCPLLSRPVWMGVACHGVELIALDFQGLRDEGAEQRQVVPSRLCFSGN